MKILIASDIHGDIECCEKTFEAFEREGAERILLLGDLLYHGPRNNLPCGYMPKKVIELLNSKKELILAVRGNCDSEVDQMVLDFPILADYAHLSWDGLSIIATHGHKFSPDSPPPMRQGEILITGHTHVYASIDFGNENHYLNPGSVTLPKNGNPKTYLVYENRSFTLKTFDGKVILEKSFK